MFWRKANHVLVISILLVGGFAAPSGAQASKILAKTEITKSNDTTIIYVDQNVTGSTFNGSSWETAYKTVQDALATASSDTQIWVAEGIYYPDEGIGQTNDVITSTFVLTDGVGLYGGFMGSEISLEERDWETHITVLSGDIDHESNPDITDSYGVVITTTNIVGDNAYHVVSSIGVTNTAIIDGFSITAGQANGSNPDNYGGGMYNIESSPTLINVTFSGNTAGWAGGMYNGEYSSPTLTDVTFSGNAADYCGGMDNGYSSPTLTNVSFRGNTASSGSGGGMCNGEYSGPTLTDVTFSGNTANTWGGGMSNFDSSPTLTNVTFSGNSAHDGGGMSNNSSSPTLINVTFSGNSASTGGGMYNRYSDPTLSNAIFWGNTASAGSQIYNASDGTPSISFSDIQGCGGSDAWEPDCGDNGGSNIDTDPLFKRDPNPAEDDYGDLHLRPGSPAIDTGTNTGCPSTDLDGDPRPVNGTCDMGAFETGYTLTISHSVDDPTPQPGQTITFTIVVANLELDVTGGLISDTIPTGLNFLELITLDPPDAGLVGEMPPTLASNLTISYTHSVTLTFPVLVSDELEAGTELVNTAAFSSTELITPVSASASITVAEPDTKWIYLPLVVGE